MVVPWPIIAYDRAVVKNCLWPCQGHGLRDSNHSIYYCMICTGYSLLALSFMLEPFIQFGEYIVMKYRGKPQIDMWFSWCFALALDVWKTCACEINVGFAQQSLVISHVRGRVPCMKAAQSSLVCDTYPTRVRDPGPSKMVAHAASDKNRLPPSRAILLSLPPCEKCCNCLLFPTQPLPNLTRVGGFQQ